MGTPDPQIGGGRHAGLRAPGGEAADGAALQGAAPHAGVSAAARAGETPVAAVTREGHASHCTMSDLSLERMPRPLPHTCPALPSSSARQN